MLNYLLELWKLIFKISHKVIIYSFIFAISSIFGTQLMWSMLRIRFIGKNKLFYLICKIVKLRSTRFLFLIGMVKIK